MPRWPSTEERFRSSLTIDGDSGCWKWNGHQENGYGGIYFRGRNTYAHRVSFELFYHEIPKFLVLDHVCRNRLCVNPTHLRMVTRGENVLLGDTLPSANLRKSHCIHGHLLSGDNLITLKNGHRRCLACKRRLSKESYDRLHRRMS